MLLQQRSNCPELQQQSTCPSLNLRPGLLQRPLSHAAPAVTVPSCCCTQRPPASVRSCSRSHHLKLIPSASVSPRPPSASRAVPAACLRLTLPRQQLSRAAAARNAQNKRIKLLQQPRPEAEPAASASIPRCSCAVYLTRLSQPLSRTAAARTARSMRLDAASNCVLRCYSSLCLTLPPQPPSGASSSASLRLALQCLRLQADCVPAQRLAALTALISRSPCPVLRCHAPFPQQQAAHATIFPRCYCTRRPRRKTRAAPAASACVRRRASSPAATAPSHHHSLMPRLLRQPRPLAVACDSALLPSSRSYAASGSSCAAETGVTPSVSGSDCSVSLCWHMPLPRYAGGLHLKETHAAPAAIVPS